MHRTTLFRMLCATAVMAVALIAPTTSSAANVAAGKPVTTWKFASNASVATDGQTASTSYANMEQGANWLQVDLGTAYPVSKLKLWHYWADGRTYRDVVVQLSNSSTFASGVTTVFNNDTNNSLGLGAGSSAEYAETSAGREFQLMAPISARYARFWSNGNSVNIYNHVVEAQVFDDPIGDSQAPSVPGGVAASAVSSSAVNVSWNASTDNVGVTQYVIARNGTDVATVNAPTTTWSDTGLSASTTYTYTVRARDAAGNTSTTSSTASATTPGTPPPAGGMQEISWHQGWQNTPIGSYPSDIRSETDIVIWAMSQSAGAGTGNLTMPPTAGYAGVAAAKTDVESYKAQGKHVLVGIGGSSDGGITITNSTQVTQAFNSIVTMVNTYGFDGISLDLEPSGSSWNQTSLVSLVQQLKARYGSSFHIDLCAALYGTYTTSWISLANALGSNMDTFSVMLYDFAEAGDSRLTVVTKQKADALVGGGVPASKIMMLYMMRPNAGYVNATPNPQLVVDAMTSIRSYYPTIGGFGWWEDNLNAGRGWDGPRAMHAAF